MIWCYQYICIIDIQIVLNTNLLVLIDWSYRHLSELSHLYKNEEYGHNLAWSENFNRKSQLFREGQKLLMHAKNQVLKPSIFYDQFVIYKHTERSVLISELPDM